MAVAEGDTVPAGGAQPPEPRAARLLGFVWGSLLPLPGLQTSELLLPWGIPRPLCCLRLVGLFDVGRKGGSCHPGLQCQLAPRAERKPLDSRLNPVKHHV